MNRELIVEPLVELAAKINAEHEKAESALRDGLLHAKRTGELLVEAKGQLEHGQWLPWLSKNCRFSKRTAQAYMRVASRWAELEAKAQGLALLTFEDGVKLLSHDKGADQDQAGCTALEEAAQKAAESHRRLSLPRLRRDRKYFALGSTGKVAFAEVVFDPHSPPDTDHFYVAVFFDTDTDNPYVEYIRRGIRSDFVGFAIEMHGFVPEGHWHE